MRAMSQYVESRDGVLRIVGSRVPLRAIVLLFRDGEPPEEIRECYPTLTIDEVNGGITYYLAHTTETDQAIEREFEEEEEILHAFKEKYPHLVKAPREVVREGSLSE